MTIKNEDELCCTRALVTMRAWCHRNDDVNGQCLYHSMHHARPVQTVQARELHQLAGVSEGLCGIPEVGKFQQVLSPQYQIKVMLANRPHPPCLSMLTLKP